MSRGEPSQTRFRLRVGGVDLSDGVVDGTITQSINDFPAGEMMVQSSALREGVEFRGEVEVDVDVDEPRPERIRLFTGQVSNVMPGNDVASMTLIGGMPELREQQIGGLSTDRVASVELLWSVLRASGMPETRIVIEDFEPGPTEPFEVVIPLGGLRIQNPYSINGVVFTGAPSAHRLVDGLGLEDLGTKFVNASAWAQTIVFDRTLFEAEVAGVRRIRHASARSLVRAHYSWSTTPGGSLRTYRRDLTRTRILLGDTVLVHGLATGRRWLRAMTDAYMRPDLLDTQVVPLDGQGEQDVPLQLQEASLAWSRVLGASDDIEATAALWDALEFYASGVRVDRLIPRDAARAIRRRALEGLEGGVRDRVADVLSNLTVPPLMVRILAAAKVDEAPLSESDIECLRMLRKFRNDFIHGRNRGQMDETVLRHGTAIVNRLLAHRYYRLG